jgi:hypothetical protein
MVLAATLAAVWNGLSAADEPAVVGGIRLPAGLAGNAVRKAVEGARRRLQDPKCGAVLSAFHDRGGRPLLDLTALGRIPPEEHLDAVLFFDGSERPVCARPTVPAATIFGSRVVLVCPRQFVRMAEHDEREAQFVVIHEMLHTLGLPENPPSPSEIRHAIAARCDAEAPDSPPQRTPSTTNSVERSR